MAGATTEINGGNFKQVIEGGGTVFLDWWAPWCGPCRAFGPIYERVAAKHPDVVWGKLNTEEEQSLAAEFGISSIPTLMIFRDRVLLFAQPGLLPEKALEELVEKVQGLDMAEVQREIEAEKKKTGAPGDARA